MCGIVGAISLRTPPENWARAMVATLSHRGPDGSAVWVSEGAALGHTRLAIIDLTEAGNQPMISANDRYVIVFNGEIYNSDELRRKLDAEGIGNAWRGHSDTEVLVECIAARGVDATLRAASGMFAFAVWDRKEQHLTLARDRAGEKPLYYGWAGDTLLFASELKALRAVNAFDPTIDSKAEALFGARGYIPAPFTIYRDARKLPPGTSLSWKSEEGRIWPVPDVYWSINKIAAESVADPISDPSAAVSALNDVLGRAVKRQLVADVPIGAFLSGGLDSSLLVALMQSQSTRPVKTFTVAFDEGGFDESPHAASVARHLGTEHHTLRVSAKAARDVVSNLSEMYDEPFADASQIPTSLIAQHASKSVKVAISGDGGDELFGGYNRYSLLPKLTRVFGPVPKSLRAGAAAALQMAPRSLVEYLAKSSGISQAVTRRVYDLAPMLSAAERPADLYAAALDCWQGRHFSEHSNVPVLQADFVNWMMLRDYNGYLPDDVLTKTDRAAMYHSLETRCPYLDPEVAILAWRLPLNLKISRGVGKLPLRQLLSHYVPPVLTSRPKAGFTPPIGEWIRGPLRHWAEELLRPERLRQQKAFDEAQVAMLWKAHRASSVDHGRRLWPVLIYSAWRERWIGAN